MIYKNGVYQALIAFAICFIVKLQISGKIIKESLLVIKDLGIQTTSNTLGGGANKNFYDISRIRDFIINDHVTFYHVRQYCAFLVENEKALVVPFKNCTRLRQLDLEYIYCSVK